MSTKKHAEFARRLNQACDGNPLVPEHGKGRQTAIANKMNISQEAVRKYFEGEARPRGEGRMKKLASILGVDEAWLALGIEATLSKSEKRQYVMSVDAGAYVMFGLFEMNGYSCAFNNEDNGPDFHAIKHGTNVAVAVTVAQERDGTLVFPVKNTYENHTNIVLVKKGKVEFDYVVMSPEIDPSLGSRKGSHWEFTIEATRGDYLLNGERLPLITETSLI